MKSKLLINLLLLLVLMFGAISMLSAADSHFCGNGYSCPGEPSDVNVAVVIPSTMVLKINGTAAPTDGRIEIGFIFHDTDGGTNWRAMTYDAGSPVALLWTGTDGGSAMYGDNSMTDPIDGFLTNSPIYIYVYDSVADKFYTISSYKLKDHNNNLITTFKSSYLYVTLEELLVYTSPVLTNPSDMAVSQPLSLNLTWDAIPVADSYDLQVSTHSDFSSPLVDMNLTATTRTLSSLTNNTRYYWRVRAVIGSVKTDWSDAEFLTQLATPSITSPSNGVTNINPSSASIGFSTVTGADSYRLTFHPTAGGSDIVVDATSSPKSVTNLLPCVEYSLTVRASNTGTTNTSQLSTAVLFTTLPKAPTLTLPANAAKNVAVRPTFTWTPDGTCSVKYKLTLWEGANTTNVTINGYAVNTYTWTSDLKNYTTYSWTVTPINSNNQEGAVSATRTFTTEVACAGLVSPANGAKGIIPGTDNLTFSQVAGGSEYTVKTFISGGADIETKVVTHAAGQANNSVSLNPALYGFSTTYSWNVTVKDVDANTKVCGPWTFTTPPPAPTLVLPADDATNVVLNPTMRLGHTGTDYTPVTNFEVVLQKTDGTAVDSKTIARTAGNTTDFTWAAALNNFTGYKWRARSKTSEPIYSGWSAWSDFTTEVACPTLVSPANDAKGVIPATDKLTFNSVTGGKEYTVDVKIFGGALVESLNAVAGAGTTYNATLTPASYNYSTKYEWTVKVKDNFDNVKSSCSTWTFTTPPAAPTLVLPADNANNVSLNPTMKLGHAGTNYTPVTNFEVLIKKADGTPVETKTIARTAGDNTEFTWTSALNNFTVYKWKARSKTSDGIFSDWSGEFTFTTEVKCATITDPTDGKHGFKPASSPFTFYQVDGAAKYTITVKDPSNAVVETKSVNHSAGAMTNSIQMVNSYNYATDFTWTMTVEDTYANTKVCGPYTFDTPPAAPVLIAPANNANGVALIPSFEVGHNGTNYTGVTQFQVIVTNVPAANEAANFTVTRNGGGNSTTFSISPATDLKPFTAHKWKARSLNSDGIYSDWSGEFNFETEVACPSPVKPTNNQKYVLVNSDIEWSSVTGASTYQLLVSKNSDMSSPFINVTQAGTTYNPADFEYRINYYWTIKVTDTHGNSKTCGPWTFETELDAPRLSWPANLATCIPIQDATGFQWQAYTGATKYDLQYSKVDNDWAHATSFTNLTATNKAFSGLDRNATYYWRVQAWVGSVPTGYSGAYSFTTIDNPVVLTSPADNACGTNPSLNFAWNAITGTTKYTIHVTTDPTFATIDFTDKTSATNTTISGMQKGRDYYWRVTSDKCGSNDLTEAEIRTFKVIPDVPTLVSPADDAVDVSSWGELEINGVTGANGYQMVISDAADFSTTAFEYLGSDLTPTYNGLNSNTHYYWKARAYETCSGTKQYSAWSNVFEFDTKLLGPPQIKYPADGAKYILLDLDLEWYAEPNVTYYALQVSTDPTFTDPEDQLVNEAKVEALLYHITGLDYGTTYYWRLRSIIAKDTNYEESGWSKAYAFTTIPEIDIAGPTEVCVGIDNIQDYSLEAIPSVTYTWSVTGGTIETDGNATDNEVRIKWTTVGTGKIKVTRSGAIWDDFTDSGSLDVNVRAVGTIDITTDTDTYYANKFCPNENIVFTAVINDANITEGDLQEYYWDFGNGNIINSKLSTTFAWPNPGTYSAKFYARTDADGCAEYTKTLTIVVTNDCPVTALLVSDNYICNGTSSALFETYVFGGAGGSLATDYKYSWVPKTSFQNPTEKDGIYIQTTTSRYVDFYAYDKNKKSGHLNFKIYLRTRPVASLISTMRVPVEVDNVDLEDSLLISYGCGTSGKPVCDGWSWVWYDANYNSIEDYNDVDIEKGINIFYLVVTNDQDCKSKMVRGVVYRVRSKEIMDYDYTFSQNATGVLFAYPNPAVNYLNVFAEFEKESNLTCSIVDLQGKVVKSFAPVTGKIFDTTIDVTDITAGTYFIMVESGNDAVIWKFNKQ